MIDQSNSKIVGAFIVGLAIVGGAYTFTNFGKPSDLPQGGQAAAVSQAPLRVPIQVSDADQNGLEDWRDQFVKSTPITLDDTAVKDYALPETLTGQASLAFLQGIISAEGYGPIGRSPEQIIEDTVTNVSRFAVDTIFDVRDITIGNDPSPAAIRLYANAHADVIINTGKKAPELRNELLILRDFLNENKPTDRKELETLAGLYRTTRDEVLALAVPPTLVKEHLDLITVYNALYNDINSMAEAGADPMLSLVRIKRYEEDATGLALALQNLFLALEPYAALVEKGDSAVYFVNFSPNTIQ